MGWTVSLTRIAQGDLEQVVSVIAADDSTAAERVGLELVAKAFRLARFSRLGPHWPKNPAVRRVVCGHILIIYRLDEAREEITILRFWDSRRDPATLVLL